MLRCSHSVRFVAILGTTLRKTASKHSNHKTTHDKATIPTKSNDLPQCTPTEYLTTQYLSMTQTKAANQIQWKNGMFVKLCVCVSNSFEKWIDELKKKERKKKQIAQKSGINERWHFDSISFYLENSIRILSNRAEKSTWKVNANVGFTKLRQHVG